MSSIPLRTKLLGAFFLVTLVSIVISAGFALYFFFDKIKDEAVTNARKHLQVAELIYRHKLGEIRHLAHFLSRDSSLQNFAYFKVEQKLHGFLQDFLEREDDLHEIIVLDKKRQVLGRVLKRGGLFQVVPEIIADPPLLDRVYRAREEVATPEAVGEGVELRLSLSAAAPIMSKSLQPEVVGAVLVRYYLNHNPALVHAMELRFPGQAAIFHEGRAISFHGRQPQIQPALYRNLVGGQSSAEHMDMRRGGVLAEYLTLYDATQKPLAVLGIQIPADAYIDTMEQAFASLLMLMAVCLAVAVLLAYGLAWGILGPVKKLMLGVQRVQAGDLHHTIELRTRDELGTLAQAFNAMAGELANFFAMLKNTVDTLTRVSNAMATEKNSEALLLLLIKETRQVTAAPASILYVLENSASEGENLRAVRKLVCTAAGIETHVLDSSYAELQQTLSQAEMRKALQVVLADRHNSPVALLQLTPWMDRASGEILPFSRAHQEIVHALASQASVAMENARNYATIQRQNQAFARFVPAEFLTHLDKRAIEEVQLGDASAEFMAVLFSDIREFTNYAEMLEPRAIFDFLNDYLHFIGPVISANGGFIDKYIGDAVMALFPGNQTSVADDALRAAIQMHERLSEFNTRRAQKNYPPIHIGIGVHAGPLVLGTIGFASRLETTVIGDTVNLASRVESLTKHYGIALGITCDIYDKLQDRGSLLAREVDTVQVKGRNEASTIYEVFDADPEPLRTRKQEISDDYHHALNLYKQRAWQEAGKILGELAQALPQDRLIEIYLQRCRTLLEQPPPPDWQGVTRLAAK